MYAGVGRNTHVGGRVTMTMPKNSRSTSAGSTVLVNLDIYIVRATIGRDISPEDDDLIVLFRRNSKEVTSEPTRWHPDHIAEWNQHVGIQTSLLRNRNHAVDGSEYLGKEYEIVLVALPSHSAVALFTMDFSDIVQTQRANRPKPFRISPTKCRDLAATLEFEVVWEFASPPPPPLTPTSSSITSASSLSMAGRRTNVSISSQCSELMPDANCSDCRSLRRRIERKEMQILQLENFLKESQKRIDSLVFENEELLVREQAETKNAGQYRALNMRLLQELEMAFQFCAQQMLQAQEQARATGSDAPPPLFMFLPQFEFMERVKKFHSELDLIFGGSSAADLHDSAVGKPPMANPMDAWKAFDFREEMEAALERNHRLQRQLEFMSRSLVYDVQPDDGPSANVSMAPSQPELKRKITSASSASDFSITDLGAPVDDPLGSSRVAPVRSITEQLNALERENFLLKAKLESAMNDLKGAQLGGGGSSPSECAETSTSSSESRQSMITASLALLPVVPDDTPMRLEVDQLREDKVALEEQVEALKAELDALRKDQLQRGSMLPPSSPPLGAQPPSPVQTSEGTTGGMSNSRTSTVSGGSGPGGSDFLNKIYIDVGKAKVALEEKVKRLTQELASAHEENGRLHAKLKDASELGNKREPTDALSESEEEEPKIVEITGDDEDEQRTVATKAWGAGAVDCYQLEAQIQQLQQLIEEKSSQIKVQEQELEFMQQHLTEKATQVTELEAAKAEFQKTYDAARAELVKAEKKITALEIKIEALEHDQLQHREAQEHQQRAVATKQSSNRDEEVSELSKQLKLARQEVMQLRYRSNNLESVHEKLEEALKEKKTLQVKLTALEGQLYEQRSRTISGTNFSSDGAKDIAMIEELQKALDQKSAQLMIAQREAENLRRELTSSQPSSGNSSGNVELAELEAKVTQFSVEISRLCERNDEQALKINALSERIESVTREKYELEGIMKEMLKEMDDFPASSPSTDVNIETGNLPVSEPNTPVMRSREPSTREESAPSPSEDSAPPSRENSSYEPVEATEDTEETATIPITVRPTGNKVVERYANALKTTFERRGSAPRAPAPSPVDASAASSSGDITPITKNKVAHLIKNFSNDDSTTEDAGPTRRRSTLGNSIKKLTKVDFRQRQASEPSS